MAKRVRDPMKERARRKLRDAVSAGKVVKPDACSVCLKEFSVRLIHGHHWHGYDKPLDVQWVCVYCHNEIDKPLARRGRFPGSLQKEPPKLPDFLARWMVQKYFESRAQIQRV